MSTDTTHILSTAGDLLTLKELLWPDVIIYDKQIEAIQSVERDDETVLVAGNQLGKDFVAGFIVVAFFLTRHPCRILTTSVKDQHLSVLWGEIGEFIRTSKYPLDYARGGPLIINHQHIRKVIDDTICPISYVKGSVASPDRAESFQGHHVKPPTGQAEDGIPRNLFVVDEASGVPDSYYKMADTWAKRKLIFGNPWTCANFFFKAVKGNLETGDPGGDIVDEFDSTRYNRKVIRIKAEDSPSVKLGLLQESFGKKPTDEALLPGLITYKRYKTRRKKLDSIQQCVTLDADFFMGAQSLLFPPEWLNAAEDLAITRPINFVGNRTMGVDTAEGGDDTVWTIIDSMGILEQISEKTPDTAVIGSRTISLIKQYGIDPKDVAFDQGGGGKEHVDYLRRQGYHVRAVFFGAGATPEKQRGMTTLERRKEQDEVRQYYKNRRAEMYHLTSMLLDPTQPGSLAIPRRFTELRRQLAPIPRLYDGEGRLYLPPKRKKDAKDNTETMTDLVGCSPDEADSLVLAVFTRSGQSSTVVVGGTRLQ